MSYIWLVIMASRKLKKGSAITFQIKIGFHNFSEKSVYGYLKKRLPLHFRKKKLSLTTLQKNLCSDSWACYIKMRMSLLFRKNIWLSLLCRKICVWILEPVTQKMGYHYFSEKIFGSHYFAEISRNGLLKACARFIIEWREIIKKQYAFKSVHFECRMVFTKIFRKIFWINRSC